MSKITSLFVRTWISISMLLVLTISANEIKSMEKALGTICAMRINTQKAMKYYMLKALHSNFKNPQKELTQTILRINHKFKAVSSFLVENEIEKKALTMSQNAWKDLKPYLEENPSYTKAKELQISLSNLSGSLEKMSIDLRKLAIQDTGRKGITIACLAARQRMLSEKIAALSLMRVWKLKDDKYESMLMKSIKLFETSMLSLKKVPYNTPIISTLLAKVDKEFFYIKIMLTEHIFSPTIALVSKRSEKLLKISTAIHMEYKKTIWKKKQ